VPWITVVAMMRAGDKLASYRMLAEATQRLDDLPWQLVIAGDGAVRAEVEKLFDHRACFLGSLAQRRIAEVLAASDVCAWPAVNEAYGMALLEAEACGVPVVSCATRGVPDVVVDGRTGVLVPYGDEDAFAGALRVLLVDHERRRSLGREAARYVAAERSLESASARIGAALSAL
jgi:glycosyltransferase involved in cell wall biosynthesis